MIIKALTFKAFFSIIYNIILRALARRGQRMIALATSAVMLESGSRHQVHRFLHKVHVHLDVETENCLRQLLPEQESKQAKVCFLLTCAAEAAQCAKKRIVPKAAVPGGPLCPIRVSEEVYDFIKSYASEGGVCMTAASTNLLFAAVEALQKAGVKEPASKEEVTQLLARAFCQPSRKEDLFAGLALIKRALWR